MTRRAGAAALGAAALLWAAASALSPHAQASRAARDELLYYPSGPFLKEAVLGYDQAASAVTWLRTVQYYGLHRRRDRKYDMMYHLCDIVTDLDPRFTEPYVFGSFVLFTDGRRPAEGEKLLLKGLAANPDSWEIAFENGFVNYVFLGNQAEAARYFTLAGTLPDAPEYTSRFAAFAAQRAGDLRMAAALWQEVAARTTNTWLREMASEKSEELRAQIDAGSAGGPVEPASGDGTP